MLLISRTYSTGRWRWSRREIPAPGRTKDSHKQMLGVANVFADAMSLSMKPDMPVEPSARTHFGVDFALVLKEYQDSAGVYRKLRDGSAEVQIDDTLGHNSQSAAAMLLDLDLVMQGPAAVAKDLVAQATLNAD